MDAENKRMQFFKNKIQKRLEELRPYMSNVKYKLYASMIEDCNSFDEIREMAELDMQFNMIKYVQELEAKLKLSDTNIEELEAVTNQNIRAAKLSIISPKRKEKPKTNADILMDIDMSTLKEDLEDEEVLESLACIIQLRIESEPDEEKEDAYEKHQEELDMFNDIDNLELDDFDDDFDSDEDDDSSEELEKDKSIEIDKHKIDIKDLTPDFSNNLLDEDDIIDFGNTEENNKENNENNKENNEDNKENNENNKEDNEDGFSLDELDKMDIEFGEDEDDDFEFEDSDFEDDGFEEDDIEKENNSDDFEFEDDDFEFEEDDEEENEKDDIDSIDDLEFDEFDDDFEEEDTENDNESLETDEDGFAFEDDDFEGFEDDEDESDDLLETDEDGFAFEDDDFEGFEDDEDEEDNEEDNNDFDIDSIGDDFEGFEDDEDEEESEERSLDSDIDSLDVDNLFDDEEDEDDDNYTFDVDDSDLEFNNTHDDFDDFLKNHQGNNKEKKNIQREIKPDKIFINGTKRGEQTQQMFNMLNTIFKNTYKTANNTSHKVREFTNDTENRLSIFTTIQ